MKVEVKIDGFATGAKGTTPEDFTEGVGEGSDLVPPSLYEDQVAKRIGQP